MLLGVPCDCDLIEAGFRLVIVGGIEKGQDDSLCITEIIAKENYKEEGDNVDLWKIEGTGTRKSEEGIFSFVVLMNFNLQRGYLEKLERVPQQSI